MKISDSGQYCLIDDEGKVKMMMEGETGLVVTEAFISVDEMLVSNTQFKTLLN